MPSAQSIAPPIVTETALERPIVGYVVRMFPQASETFIANEINELVRSGVDVRIFSCRHPRKPVLHASVRRLAGRSTELPDPLYKSAPSLARACVRQYRADPRRFRRTVRFTVAQMTKSRRLDLGKRFLQAVCVARAAETAGAQHLHAHFAHSATQVAMLAGLLSGLEFSFTAHARDIYSDDVDHRLLREQIARASFAVTVSEFNKAYLTEKTGSAAGRRLDVLYNGIDLEMFSPDPGIPRDPSQVLAVGRLVEKKGLTHLIDALRILRDRGQDFHCQIVGEGELHDDLQRQIAEDGLHHMVELTGLRCQEDLPALYRRAALVVMPAVEATDGNRDALPTVLLEAMGCATPVVASRLTGIPEIVDDHENGFLVAPGEPAALADAIATLLADDDLRERFGKAARAKAEQAFDLTHNVAILRSKIDRSLQSTGATP